MKNTIQLNPDFITGFTDGEGSFGIYLAKREKSRLGWSVEPSFKIELHSRDIKLLKLIQAFFGIGSIIKNRRNSVSFYVYSLDQISNVIIPHFDKYPLITQKQADYLLFREVIMMMVKKEHLTREGLDKIIAIRASINNGLTEKFKATFPLTKPVARPLVENQLIPHPFWVAGFTEGEGCFSIQVRRSKTHKTGFQIILKFQLTQHCRDEQLMKRGDLKHT